MKNDNEILEQKANEAHASTVMAGLLIGSLAGAGAMLLLAPKSGREMRTQLAEKTIELRDLAVETVEGTANKAQSKTRELTEEVRGKAGELKHQGKHLIARQLERAAEAADAGRKAIENS